MDIRPYLIAAALAVLGHAAQAEQAAAPVNAPLALAKWREQNCVNEGEGRRQYCHEQLEALDRKLNVAFREAVAFQREPASLRAHQRSWLVNSRDACAAFECSKEVMVGRILELQAMAVAARGRREMPMTAAEQAQICDEVAAIESRGELDAHVIEPGMMPEKILTTEERARAGENLHSGYGHEVTRIFTMPIRHDQEIAFADFNTGGSCNSNEIFPLWTPSLRPTEHWPGSEIDFEDEEGSELVRWAHWGGWDSILVHRGRYLLVASDFRGIKTITWVTPGATLRPLCALATTKVVRSVVMSRVNRNLCEAVAARTLTPADYSETDIDNDGVKEYLQRHRTDSGAACGSSEIWNEVIDPRTDEVVAGPLNDALAGLSMHDENPGEIYDFEGVRYVEAQLERTPALFKVTRDSIETECIFQDRPIKAVSKVFPLNQQSPE